MCTFCRTFLNKLDPTISNEAIQIYSQFPKYQTYIHLMIRINTTCFLRTSQRYEEYLKKPASLLPSRFCCHALGFLPECLVSLIIFRTEKMTQTFMRGFLYVPGIFFFSYSLEYFLKHGSYTSQRLCIPHSSTLLSLCTGCPR